MKGGREQTPRDCRVTPPGSQAPALGQGWRKGCWPPGWLLWPFPTDLTPRRPAPFSHTLVIFIYSYIYYSYILKRGKTKKQKNLPEETPEGSKWLRSLLSPHPQKFSHIKSSSAIFRKPPHAQLPPRPWTAPQLQPSARRHPVSSLAVHRRHGFLLRAPLLCSGGPRGLWVVEVVEAVGRGGGGWDPGGLVAGRGRGPEGAEVCRG